MTSEEKRQSHQKELAEKLNEEARARLAGQKEKTDEKKCVPLCDVYYVAFISAVSAYIPSLLFFCHCLFFSLPSTSILVTHTFQGVLTATSTMLGFQLGFIVTTMMQLVNCVHITQPKTQIVPINYDVLFAVGKLHRAYGPVILPMST